jgi:hypothetical protein
MNFIPYDEKNEDEWIYPLDEIIIKMKRGYS